MAIPLRNGHLHMQPTNLRHALIGSCARRYLQELPIRLVRDDVDRAVRPLSYIADAFPPIGEQMFLSDHAIILNRQSYEPLGS